MISNQLVKSAVPTFEQAVEIHLRLFQGEYQHNIAAAIGMNQGRISEVKMGKRFPDAKLEALRRIRGGTNG